MVEGVRANYVVLNRYRSRGKWQEEGEVLSLLVVEAQGQLSLGNLELKPKGGVDISSKKSKKGAE